MDRNYEDLANAIVVQAVKDYREALNKLKKEPRSIGAKVTKLEIEIFFRSSWYRELTTLDPEMLIEKLKEEIA
ncbi:hypothetical protein [Tissierella creatinophila]|nr:hypothetical protein [Tissierella creatinophila]